MIAFRYKATIVRWVDGDTVDCEVDLGFYTVSRQRFRLDGINTPERGQPGYADAILLASEQCPVGSKVEIESTKTEKFGRWLAVVWTRDGESINAKLISAGLAKHYSGGPRV